MKKIQYLMMSLTFLVGLSLECLGQEPTDVGSRFFDRINYFNRLCTQEKVYLHFDNTAYFRGETIWFAATVADASNLGEAASKILYVELLSPTGVVLKQQKLKIVDGRCYGSFSLIDNDVERAVELRGAVPYPSGYYEVRAYTHAMLSYDGSRVFSRVFPVYQSPEEEGDYSHPLVAAYPGREADRPSPELPLRRDKLNVAFYPEGGHIVAGETCRIAFKASDEHGMGIAVDSICDSRGQLLHVDSGHGGMGAFMYHPDRTRDQLTVYAMGQKTTWTLPKAESSGYILQYRKEQGKLLFTVRSRSMSSADSINYMLTSGGNVYEYGTLYQRGSDIDTTLTFSASLLPTGVAQLTLLTGEGQTIANRLLYVDNGMQYQPLTISAIPDALKPYDSVNLDIRSAGPSTFSLSVRDAADYGTASQDDIRTYLLLSSELKGYIENPGWYFGDAPEEERTNALDLLMMVQGWTRYDWQQAPSMRLGGRHHEPEEDLMVDGWAFNRITGKPVIGTRVGIKLFSPDRKYKQQAWAKTDSTGYWRVHLVDYHGDWDLYLYTQQNSKNPEKEMTRLRLGRSSSPRVRAYQPEEMFIPGYAGDERDLAMWKEEIQKPLVQVLPDVADIIGDSYLLEEVEIKGKRRYIDYNRFHAFDGERDSEQVLDEGGYTGDILAFLERKGYGYTIDYPDMGENMKDAYTLQSATKVSIDGHLTYWTTPANHSSIHRHDDQPDTPANSLWAADMEDVKNVIVYDYEPGHRYVEVEVTFLEENERKARAKNVRQTTFAGYSQPVEFYAPTYPNGPVAGDKDYRRTVYWNPEITTDSTGCATISFYNNGYSRTLTVSAEGLTRDGKFILNEK